MSIATPVTDVQTNPTSTQLNPTQIDRPAYLMNVPFSYSAQNANNAWMRDLDDAGRAIDSKGAISQFMSLYQFMASGALVYLLPTPSQCNLQDLVFTANLGIVLTHLPDQNTVVLSNYMSPPRQGEELVGKAFFESMGYNVVMSPHKFEGEAELKHLKDNVYIGGYGIRSDIEAYEWMEREFDMKIIKVKETDEYLYHLDTSIFPICHEKTLVCTEMYEENEIAEIEKHTEIIDVSVDACYSGLCNSVRVDNTILNASNIEDMTRGTKEYDEEKAKNRILEDIVAEEGFDLVFFNLKEYLKGGALLSCMVMHLNRNSYNFRLI